MASTLDIGTAQGQGTGKPVGIPDIQPQTQAALAPSPKQLTVPDRIPITTPGMFDGIKDAANKLGDIFAAQEANRYHLQIAGQVDSFMQQSAQIKADAMQNGTSIPKDPNSMAGLYQAQAGKVWQQIQADPANASIVDALQMHIGRIMAHDTEDLTLAMPKAAQAEQDAQLKALADSKSAIAAGYQVGKDGKITDTANAQTARQDYYSLLDKFYRNQPQRAGLAKTVFEAQVTVQRATALANDPSQAAKMLLPSTKQNPAFATVTPEQWEHIQSAADATINHPVKVVNTNQALAKANAYQQLQDLQAKGDPSLGSTALQYQRLGFIDDTQYRNFTGSKPPPERTISAPGLVDSWKKQIDDDPMGVSPAEVRGISSADISPDDRRQLSAYQRNAQDAAKKPIGAAYIQGRAQIRDAILPHGMVQLNAAAARQKVADALSDFDALNKEGFKSVGEVLKARDMVIKTQLGDRTAKTRPHIDLSALAHKPGESMSAYGARLRTAGITGLEPTTAGGASAPGAE